jgi:hypothetical protein
MNAQLVKQALNHGAMKMNGMQDPRADGPRTQPLTSAAGPVGPVGQEDLSRFEGEGGREAPIPDLVDVPLNGAIWRRPCWAAHQTTQVNLTT